MDISLKDMLGCVDADLSGDTSVLGRLFGFLGGSVPPDPTGAQVAVTLREKSTDLEGDHIHLNVIQVGFDLLHPTAYQDAVNDINYSIFRTRNIYRTRGVGVGRVQHYEVLDEDADGMGWLNSDDEARDLWEAFYVDNDGIDCFVSRGYSTSLGLSPPGGSCNKQSTESGLVAGAVTAPDGLGGLANRDADGFSRTFAHEVGHQLGLDHNHVSLGDGGSCPTTTSGQDNLMAQTGCAISTRTSVLLTATQGNDMDDHCFVKNGC